MYVNINTVHLSGFTSSGPSVQRDGVKARTQRGARRSAHAWDARAPLKAGPVVTREQPLF